MEFKFKKADLGVFSTSDSDAAVRELKKGARLIGLTNGQFSLIDMIYSILKKTGPAHVVCATWSAGIKDAHQCKWMQDTNLIRSFQLLTDHSYATRQKKYAKSITELFGAENIRTAEMHAKFVLIHNESWKVCIRSSMNLNANKTCECYEIDCDEEIFDFFMSWVKHHFGAMPAGFEKSSRKARKSMDDYFSKMNQNMKGWWK